jgi:hypothetical protein
VSVCCCGLPINFLSSHVLFILAVCTCGKLDTFIARFARLSSNGYLFANLAYNGLWLVQEHSLPDWFFAPPPTDVTSSIKC